MRAVLHLCAAALVAPQVLVVSAFLILGHVTAGRTLGSLIARMWNLFTALFGWGGLAVLVAIVIVAGAGFSIRSRRFASAAVILAAIASTVVFVVQLGAATALQEMPLLIPAFVAIALSGWVIRLDTRRAALASDGARAPIIRAR